MVTSSLPEWIAPKKIEPLAAKVFQQLQQSDISQDALACNAANMSCGLHSASFKESL